MFKCLPSFYYQINDYYDYATVISNITNPLIEQLFKKKEYFNKKYFGEKFTEKEYYDKLHNNLDEICEYIGFDIKYVALLKKYWDIIKIYPIFHYDMRHNNLKDNIFPNDLVKKSINNIRQSRG